MITLAAYGLLALTGYSIARLPVTGGQFWLAWGCALGVLAAMFCRPGTAAGPPATMTHYGLLCLLTLTAWALPHYRR